MEEPLPLTILDILNNSLILDVIVTNLPLASIFALSRLSRTFRTLINKTPNVFRCVDLSKCKGAYIPTISRIDTGGHSWRAERMDENLTEDEFYAGPLRGVLNKLSKMQILQSIHTLILDNLASVTNDLLNDIVTGSDYNVRLLSIRRCPNINPVKLQQLLAYMCRPSRPEGTPRLQGVYIFSEPALSEGHARASSTSFGITATDGALLGILPTEKGRGVWNDSEAWYSPSGKVIQLGSAQRTTWEETLQICKGIICFDAVLCTHMHADMAPVLHEASKEFLSENKPGIPPIATLALGPEGCSNCGRGPVGTPVWGESDYHEFPLLWPPPFSGRVVDAVRPPLRTLTPGESRQPQRLIVSCTWCVVNRHCDSCHRWWCADCYNPKKSKKLRDLESLSDYGIAYVPAGMELGAAGDKIKVFNGFCVENCLVGEWMLGAGGGGMWG